MTAHDDVARRLQSLQREHWQRPDHEVELRERLARLAEAESVIRLTDRRRRRFLVAGLLLGGLLTGTTLTACGGLRWLGEFFTMRIFGVTRDDDGRIDEVVLEDGDGRRVQLKRVADDPDAPRLELDPPEDVELPNVNGGTVRLRVFLDEGVGIIAGYQAPEMAPLGGTIQIRRVPPRSYRVELLGDRIVLHDVADPAGPVTVTLHRLRDRPNGFGNRRAVVELLP